MTDAKPGIFIATPAYAGMVHYTYTQSLISTFAWSVSQRVSLGAYMIGNESCISRGRNTCVHEFLKTGLSKLLFIDADLQWEPKHIEMLWNSPHKVIGGTYPVKKLPISINVNPLPEDERTYFPSVQRTQEQYAKWSAGREAIPVRHLPNGFLMLDRQVLEDLRPHCATYNAVDMRTGIVEKHVEYFWMGAKSNTFMTEDWYLSELVTKVGYVPHLQTQIILPHTGVYTFQAEI